MEYLGNLLDRVLVGDILQETNFQVGQVAAVAQVAPIAPVQRASPTLTKFQSGTEISQFGHPGQVINYQRLAFNELASTDANIYVFNNNKSDMDKHWRFGW